jgi:RNA polymerase sigma-70 factor (ECF subfamily)
MSVITAVYPHAVTNDSTHVTNSSYAYRPAPWGGDRHSGHEHRRSVAWEDQFTALVHARLPRLQRLARRILHGEDLADDAVQEALLSFWQEGRMPQNPEGWLVRAVVLRSLHLNRSRRRRRGYEGRAGAIRPEFDPCGDASRALELQDVALAVSALLAELPEHLRTVFVLREAEQRDYESIAAVLGVPLGTVRSRLHRAREALREGLGALACA